MSILGSMARLSRSATSALAMNVGITSFRPRNVLSASNALAVGGLPLAFLFRSAHDNIYNVLWALVFAFATINILSLGARHFDPDRRGLSFGELLAVMVVIVSLLLLAWEMLYLFHILPLRLPLR